MFGRRDPNQPTPTATVAPTPPVATKIDDEVAIENSNIAPADQVQNTKLEQARKRIWQDLREGIDLKSLAKMTPEQARQEIALAVDEIARFRQLNLKQAEVQRYVGLWPFGNFVGP